MAYADAASPVAILTLSCPQRQHMSEHGIGGWRGKLIIMCFPFPRSAMNTRQEPLLGVGSMTVDYGGDSGFGRHVGCGDCGRVVSAVSVIK
eukprot:scaffold15919_cov90-Cyclotella_meneghiniana.AAC.6